MLRWSLASAGAVVLVWTGLALLSVLHGVLLAQQDGRTVDLARMVPFRLADWYSCAVFTPLFVWLARRWPPDRRGWRRQVAAWVAVTALIVPIKFALRTITLQLLGVPGIARSLPEIIAFGFVPELIAFWAMAGVILAVEYHDRWSQRDAEANRLGRQLAEARLAALTAQLQPHFLFNTLQSISTLLHRDPRGADRMLARLSDLLRRTLRHGESPEVPLSEELATLEHYVAIQRVRFEDRLDIQVSTDGTADVAVPTFILQPLVENAIRHGVARNAGAGRIRVTASVSDDQVTLEVANDGPRTEAITSSHGVGLANTRARLAARYGDEASLHARAGDVSGFVVTITLPRLPVARAA